MANVKFKASLSNTADKLFNVASYEAIKGCCKSVKLDKIEKHSFAPISGRYVGILDEEDGIPFDDKMKDLTTTIAGQIAKEKVLDGRLKEQLVKIGFVL